MTLEPNSLRNSTRSLRKAPLITSEVIGWSTLAMFAAGYLVVLGLAPEWLEDLTPTAMLDAQPSSNQTAARLAGDVRSLRDSVSQVQLELSKVKAEVAGTSETQKVMSAQIAAIVGQSTTNQAANSSGQSSVAKDAGISQGAAAAISPQQPNTEIGKAGGTTSNDGTVQVNAAATPKLINADSKDANLSFETGSVTSAKALETAAATPAIDFGPAVVKPLAKPVGVKISSGASIDSLRLSWSLLSDRHADTLRNLEARYTTNGDAVNPNYDLIAGPIKTRAEAGRVCKALAAKNVPCKVGDFVGDAL